MSDRSAHSETRWSRIREIVSTYIERESRGEAPDEQALLSEHPDLLPELADELKRLRLVALARRNFERAHDPSHAVTSEFSQASIETAHLSVRCPHCFANVEILADLPWTDITCISCGRTFSLASDNAPTRSAPSLKRIGHFELIERIGVGGFGTVWKARDTILDRTVALKLPRRGQLSDGESDKFLREARAAAQLRHPNIVSVHEIGRTDETVYIVSDLVRGVNLADWLAIRSPTPQESAKLCETTARALQHAHRAGIVHRDLKPGNIMVDAENQPHIMDFGLAKRDVGEVTMTLEGQVLGTPAYMAPEQARGQAHLCSPRTDVYSLGVVLYELLSGELPFRGNTNMLLHQVLHDDPPSPRKLNHLIPLDLETICLRCLEKDPARRFADGGDLADELQRFLTHQPIVSRPLRWPQRIARWILRHRAMASMLTAMILLAITAIVVSTYFATLAFVAQGEAETFKLDAAESRRVAEASEQKVQRQGAEFFADSSTFFAAGAALLRTPFNRQLQSVSPIWQTHPDLALTLLEDDARCPRNMRDFLWSYVHRHCVRPIQTTPVLDEPLRAAQWAADGRELALLFASGRCQHFVVSEQGSGLRLRDERVWRYDAERAVAIRPTDLTPTQLVDGSLQVLARVDGSVDAAQAFHHAAWPTSAAQALAYSANGRYLAAVFVTEGGAKATVWLADLMQQTATFVGDISWSATDTARLQIAENGLVVECEHGTLFHRWNCDQGHWTADSDTTPDKLGVLGTTVQLTWSISFRDGRLGWSEAGGKPLPLSPSPEFGKLQWAGMPSSGASLAALSTRGHLAFWRFAHTVPYALPAGEQAVLIECARSTPRCAVATQRALYFFNLERGEPLDSPIQLDHPIRQLVWGGDGTRLAYVDDGGQIAIVNLQSSERQIFEVPLADGDRCSCLTFESEDRLIYGTQQGSLMAWRVSTRETQELGRLDQPITAVATCVTPAAILAAAGKEVQILRAGDRTLYLRGHKTPITRLSVNDTGDTVVSCSEDGMVKRWRVNWNTLRVIRFDLNATSTSPLTAEFSPDEKTLAMIHDRAILFWDARAGEYRGFLVAEKPLRLARFASLPKESTNQLLTIDVDGQLRSYIGYSFARQPTSYFGGTVRALAALPERNGICAVGDPSQVATFSAENPDDRLIISYGGPISTLGLATGQRPQLALSRADQSLEILATNERSGDWLSAAVWPVPARIDHLAFDGARQAVYAITGARRMLRIDVRNGQVNEIPAVSAHQPTAVALRADGSRLTIGTASGHVQHWAPDQWETAPQGAANPSHRGPVLALRESADGLWMSLGADQQLVVHAADLSSQLAASEQPLARCLAAHPRESQWAVGAGRAIQLWTWDGQQLRRKGAPWLDHETDVCALVYSAEGHTLISASEDRAVKRWKVNKQEGKPAPELPPEVRALMEARGKP